MFLVTIGGLALLLALWSPSLYLPLYGVMAADRDGYAVLQLISLVYPEYKLITRGAFLVGYLVATIYYYSQSNRFPRPMRVVMNVVQILALYILVVTLAKGEGFEKAFSFLVYSGLPVYVIWTAQASRGWHVRRFYLFMVVQMSLAIAILLIPEIGFLNGANYKQMEGVSVAESHDVNVGDTFDKDKVGGFGQFHNPNALGFYAATSVALGLLASRLLGGGVLPRVVGIYLVFLGVLGWLNSLTRGPVLMLLIGVILAKIFVAQKSAKASSHGRMSNAGLLAALGLLMLAGGTGLLSYLTPDSSNISVTGRIEGYLAGFDAVLAHPVLGITTDWVWVDLAYPHLLPLSFSAEYGLIGGGLIFLVVFVGGGLTIMKAMKNGSSLSSDRRAAHVLAIYLILVVWGAGLTNNLIAPILFWMAFGEAVILTYGSGIKNKMRRSNSSKV